jgi:hypothetical protein
MAKTNPPTSDVEKNPAASERLAASEDTSTPPDKAPSSKLVKTRDDVPQTRKVRAIGRGCYYNDERKRAGDVFRIRPPYTLKGPKKDDKPIEYDEFSQSGMEDVDEDTPEKTTTGKEHLRKEHDEILRSKHPPGVLPQDRNVLGDD